MNVHQILQELERQKTSIERAIAALKEVSGIGSNSELTATDSASTGREGRQDQRRPRRKEANRRGATDRPKVVVGPRNTPANKKTALRKSKRTKPSYTDQFRRQVVAAVRKGMSFGEAARKFKVTYYSVREWANSLRFEPQAEQVPSTKVARKKGAPSRAQVKQTAA